MNKIRNGEIHLTEEQQIDLLEQMLHALELTSKKTRGSSQDDSRMHADIKPENLLYKQRDDGGVDLVLADFGGVAPWHQEIEQGRALVATPKYVQKRDHDAYTRAKDSDNPTEQKQCLQNIRLAAMGHSLFKILTGADPFDRSGAAVKGYPGLYYAGRPNQKKMVRMMRERGVSFPVIHCIGRALSNDRPTVEELRADLMLYVKDRYPQLYQHWERVYHDYAGEKQRLIGLEGDG